MPAAVSGASDMANAAVPSGRVAHHASRSRMIARAKQAHDEGELARAEWLYRELLRADPDDVEALHRLGMLNYQRGHLGVAQALIRTALKVDDRRAAAHQDLGLVL